MRFLLGIFEFSDRIGKSYTICKTILERGRKKPAISVKIKLTKKMKLVATFIRIEETAA